MALLEFRSKAAGGFFMMSETFDTVCKVLGRPYQESGCILPEDLPECLKALEEEVRQEKIWLAEQAKKRAEHEKQSRAMFRPLSEEEADELEQEKAQNRVSFGMRVYPLVTMIQAAIKKQEKVMWGVP